MPQTIDCSYNTHLRTFVPITTFFQTRKLMNILPIFGTPIESRCRSGAGSVPVGTELPPILYMVPQQVPGDAHEADLSQPVLLPGPTPPAAGLPCLNPASQSTTKWRTEIPQNSEGSSLSSQHLGANMEEETKDRWAYDPRLLQIWRHSFQNSTRCRKISPQPGYPFRPLLSGTQKVGYCPETTWGYPLRRHCLIYYTMLYQYHYYFKSINLFWYIEWPIYAFLFYISH